MPILIAVGVCTMLAMMSLTSQLTANMNNRKFITRIDRMEGFYVGELLAWHTHLRKSDGWPASGKAVASLPLPDLSTMTAEQLPVDRGTPLNVATTRALAPTQQLIRRVPAGGLVHSSESGDCGYFSNQKNRLKVCLANTTAAPSSLALLISSDFRDSSGVQTTAVWGLDRTGTLLDTFGDKGKIITPFDHVFSTTHTPIVASLGTDEWAVFGFRFYPPGSWTQNSGLTEPRHELSTQTACCNSTR